MLVAGEGGELLDAGLDVVPCDPLTRLDGGEVHFVGHRPVVVDGLGRDVEPEDPLGLHHRDPQVALQPHLALGRPQLDHRVARIARRQDVRQDGFHAPSLAGGRPFEGKRPLYGRFPSKTRTAQAPGRRIRMVARRAPPPSTRTPPSATSRIVLLLLPVRGRASELDATSTATVLVVELDSPGLPATSIVVVVDSTGLFSTVGVGDGGVVSSVDGGVLSSVDGGVVSSVDCGVVSSVVGGVYSSSQQNVMWLIWFFHLS